MSDDNSKDKFDDFQKHLQSMFRNLGSSGINIFADDQEPPVVEEEEDDEFEEEESEALEAVYSFNLRPRDVKAYLDRYVIKQDEAKKVLAVAICDHYNHVRRCLDNDELDEREYAKQNVLLLGPTGVGKTYLMRNIAKLIGVPFVKADATKFSETGYVGHDVEDLVRDLVKLADGNIELAEYGIIYIDEIDKVASQSTGGMRDISGRGVQINLLKLMEESNVNLQGQSDMAGQMEAMMNVMNRNEVQHTINTRHILFIVSGAFDKLAEKIRKRVKGSQIGFDKDQTIEDEDESVYLGQAQTRDFIDYGFEPEFIGRLPVRVACNSLSADDLEEVLRCSKGSILQQYKDDFDGYGIRLEVAEDALRRIAEQAHGEGTGARGLMTVMERVFRDFKFELPSTTITELTITATTIDDPGAELSTLLELHPLRPPEPVEPLLPAESAPEPKTEVETEAEPRVEVETTPLKRPREIIADYADEFKAKHEIELTFTEDGMDAIVERAALSNVGIAEFCEDSFYEFPFALALIRRHCGRDKFEINRAAVENPNDTLNDWVTASAT
jgi:ATP-dependent Clp protease ATP-binding subunit ClpX